MPRCFKVFEGHRHDEHASESVRRGRVRARLHGGAADLLLLFTGLAVDTGRAYVVKAQLTKAVDGAALGAARNLNSGNPEGGGDANLPGELPGRTTWASRRSTDPTTDPSFFALTTITATGVNTVTVTASAILPTTFMQLANFTR